MGKEDRPGGGGADRGQQHGGGGDVERGPDVRVVLLRDRLGQRFQRLLNSSAASTLAMQTASTAHSM